MLILLAVAVVPAGATFTCTPTHVWDGDGPVWCAEGPHVRLSGIAAREIDGTCKPGHPCPAASGPAARDRLVALLGGPKGVVSTGHILVSGPRLSCRSTGSGGRNRTAAWCIPTLRPRPVLRDGRDRDGAPVVSVLEIARLRDRAPLRQQAGMPAAISEHELWACANMVIETHGDGAPLFVAEQIGALALKGDNAGIAVWKSIAARIQSLTMPPAERLL